MELWKQIEGHEGAYLISNTGKIFNQKTKKYLKPSVASNGYLHVTLCYGKREDVFIHREVAKAFIPNSDNYTVINHIDENKLNNNANNLEWCNHKYNLNYGKMQTSRNKSVVSIDRYNRKCFFASMKEASEKLGVRYQGISAVCRGVKKTCGGFRWEYSE